MFRSLEHSNLSRHLHNVLTYTQDLKHQVCPTMIHLFVFIMIWKTTSSDMTTEEVKYLSELSLDKLLLLKSTLKDFTTAYDNVSVSTPSYDRFGAQAMAIKAPPKRKMDYEDGMYKKGEHSKISNIFTMSVTTLAFLAFGGYLLCLIVQAIKSKQNTLVTTPTPTFFVNAGIKRPQTSFSSYGRLKRERRKRGLNDVDFPPEVLFSALLQLCEGYAKWSTNKL